VGASTAAVDGTAGAIVATGGAAGGAAGGTSGAVVPVKKQPESERVMIKNRNVTTRVGLLNISTSMVKQVVPLSRSNIKITLI
jgi:hypothetical protein